jgi:hypothetical protein
MRHFLAEPLAVAPLALRVRPAAIEARLIATPRRALARAPGLARAARAAVAVAPVAPAADEEDLAARGPRAGDESQ